MAFGLGSITKAILLQETQTNVEITVSSTIAFLNGFNFRSIYRTIDKYFTTSKISKYMYVTNANKKWVFNKFFALEVRYMLQAIVEDENGNHQISMYDIIVLKRIIVLLNENTWLSRTLNKVEFSKLNTKALSLFNKSPLPHQEQFFKKYDINTQRYNLTGYLLASPAGTGKTLTNLMLMSMREMDVHIIVSPNNAIYDVWENALKLEFKTPITKYWISGSNKEPEVGCTHYICHYEALKKLINIAPKLSRYKVGITLDESHNMNEIKSMRTELFIELCKLTNSQDIVWSSGTPLKALGTESIPLLKTIDPLFVDKVAFRFKKIFGAVRPIALSIVAHRIGEVSHKVEKAIIRTNPMPIEEDILVKFEGMDKYLLSNIVEEVKAFIDQRLKTYTHFMQNYKDTFYAILKEHENDLKDPAKYKLYRANLSLIISRRDYRDIPDQIQMCNKYEKEYIEPQLDPKLRAAFRDAKSVVKYVELKVRGEALGNIVAKRRTECTIEMIPHIGIPVLIDNAKKKTLIFTTNVETVDACVNYLKENKYNPRAVYGNAENDLNSSVKDFKIDPTLNPIVATYKSLSTAVPMIEANVLILLNQPFRDYEKTQSISRIDRLGQDSQTYVFNVLLDTGDEPNISTRSLDILQWSKDQVDLLLGDGVSIETFKESIAQMDQFFYIKEKINESKFLNW